MIVFLFSNLFSRHILPNIRKQALWLVCVVCVGGGGVGGGVSGIYTINLVLVCFSLDIEVNSIQK